MLERIKDLINQRIGKGNQGRFFPLKETLYFKGILPDGRAPYAPNYIFPSTEPGILTFKIKNIRMCLSGWHFVSELSLTEWLNHSMNIYLVIPHGRTIVRDRNNHYEKYVTEQLEFVGQIDPELYRKPETWGS